jgi:hypothetical protein
VKTLGKNGKACSFEGCSKPEWATGLCQGHLGQVYKGRALVPLRSHGKIVPCTFDGCKHDTSKGSHGYCGAHWLQIKEGRTPRILRRNNSSVPWIMAHKDHVGDECLTWPFPLGARGRGEIKFNGKACNAAHAMCWAAYGPPPTPQYDAAHSCGKGHLGYVNPRHLRWATKKENQADRWEHGTILIGEKHPMARLTKEDVVGIRILRTLPRALVASVYGVSKATINDVVYRRSWRHVV